jgi:L-alanine-DL-glutamate epimerase-like enolase superfamily enzyme
MTIATAQADRFSIPLPETLSDSTHGEMSFFELVCVRIRDQGGAEGICNTYTVGTAADATLSLIRDDLSPLLVGARASRIEGLWRRMWRRLHYAGRGGPGQLCPLRYRYRFVAPSGPPQSGGFSLCGRDGFIFALDKLLAQTQANMDKGFHAIKMKVGRDKLNEDLARVAAMRNFLGSDFPLMVDANMRLRENQAICTARALAEHRLVWWEEPTIPDDPLAHRRVVHEGGLPIAAGKNLHNPVRVPQSHRRGRCRFS